MREGTGVGASIIKNLGVDVRRVRMEIEMRVTPGREPATTGKLPQASGVRAVIEYAILEARDFDHQYIGTEHLLLGLLREHDGLGAQVLRSLGLTLEGARGELLRSVGRGPKATRFPAPTASRRAESGLFGAFTDHARKVMALANQEAQRFNHEYIGTEHILLGLVKEGSGVGANVLKNLDVDLRKVRLEVEKLVKAGPEMVTMGKLPQTPRVMQVIKYAIEEARNLNHNYVGTEHLLLGLLREHDGVAAWVLRNLGLRLEEVREEVLNLLADAESPESGEAPPLRREGCELCLVLPELERGSRPQLIAELRETFAVLADNQGCRGWCVAILKDHVEHMADLPAEREMRVFEDVARIAAAIRDVFHDSGKDGGPPRINYECLGNLVPHVHWHVIPRHADDPEPTRPVWGWPDERLRGTMSEEERRELIAKLRAALEE